MINGLSIKNLQQTITIQTICILHTNAYGTIVMIFFVELTCFTTLLLENVAPTSCIRVLLLLRFLFCIFGIAGIIEIAFLRPEA